MKDRRSLFVAVQNTKVRTPCRPVFGSPLASEFELEICCVLFHLSCSRFSWATPTLSSTHPCRPSRVRSLLQLQRSIVIGDNADMSSLLSANMIFMTISCVLRNTRTCTRSEFSSVDPVFDSQLCPVGAWIQFLGKNPLPENSQSTSEPTSYQTNDNDQ